MGTWKYEVETKEGKLEAILVHVVNGKEKVTLVLSSVPVEKVKEVA